MTNEFDIFDGKYCKVTFKPDNQKFFMKGVVRIVGRFLQIVEHDKAVLIDKKNVISVVMV